MCQSGDKVAISYPVLCVHLSAGTLAFPSLDLLNDIAGSSILALVEIHTPMCSVIPVCLTECRVLALVLVCKSVHNT